MLGWGEQYIALAAPYLDKIHTIHALYNTDMRTVFSHVRCSETGLQHRLMASSCFIYIHENQEMHKNFLRWI